MSGFFKKLFNRITGKTEAPAPAPEPAPEVAALPAPEPAIAEAVPEVQPEVREAASKPVPIPTEVAAPAVVARDVKAPRPETFTPKTRVTAKPEAKKPAAKKADPKKAEAKKAESKKAEPKGAAAKPVAGKKAVAKPVPVKAAPKPAEPAVPPPAYVPPPVAPTAPPPADMAPPMAQAEEMAVPTVPVTAAKPVPAPVAAPQEEAPKAKGGWLSRLTLGLSKSSKSITGSITAIFTKRKLDAETLQDLEDTLIQADLGVTVAERIIKAVSQGRYDKEIDPEEVKQILASEVGKVLQPVEVPFNFGAEKPFVILVVGVNGSGKTTTIGKLGAIAAGEGFKVKFAACDTFRAAAIEQLTVWGKRIGAETVSRPPGSDAAGLAFDAMKSARDDGTDIVFIDTAGRLHNKTYLMDELDKVVRVIKKYDEAAPHAVLLVLDATTGQNALAQAEAFTKVAGVTGLIMTKLDGTARGGILVAIAERFKLPIHAIGVGESIEDLQPFDAEAFSRAIAGLDGN